MDKIQKINEMLEQVRKGGSLVNNFKILSQRWGMSVNSVRNFYYTQINNLQNEKYAKAIGVDLVGINKIHFDTFSEMDKENLVRQVLMAKSNGESVRSVCLRLASGDANKMIRFQNKYRAILKNNPEYIDSIANKYNISSNKNNVIKIKSKPARLNDKDINNLFMGLVRLIKNNSIAQVSDALKKECSIAHNSLNKMKEELKIVKEELEEEKRKNKQLSSEMVAIKDVSKLDAYKEYLNNIAKNTEKTDEIIDK